MARYVLSNRRAGKFHDVEKRASRAAAEQSFLLLEPGAEVVSRLAPADETAREVIVFDANPAEVAAKAALAGPDVLIEPEILHFPVPPLPLDLARAGRSSPPGAALAGAGTTFEITVAGGAAAPLANAEAMLVLRSAGGTQTTLSARTGSTGKATFSFSGAWTPAALVVLPAGDHWTMVVRGPASGVTVTCPPLPDTGTVAWWHKALGLSAPVHEWGEGITVGVADTGAGPHRDLRHVVDAGAFINAAHATTAGAGRDVASHGSHVCGTIGARPSATSRRPGGIAPGVDLIVARVFPGPDAGANQGDIANAIDELSRTRRADLVNMSLGAPQPSEIEHDAIVDASERGTLCVCAAANSAGPVEFPAAFPECIAVSALGLEGWGPPGSLASIRLPQEPEKFGDDNLYLANFSCFGPEIDCAAPGVGIIAPVPERFGMVAPYAPMDGTSMASPAACGLLAAVLSASPAYRQLPRDLTRAEKARSLLRQVSRDIGLAPRYQGRGIPSAAKLVVK
ncbi:MAG TPA: S8 family serine peptidase [Acidimicrobiales bacterium]|nr:S8 family serine peptidase [Acidimicrobiales bacterium]